MPSPIRLEELVAKHRDRVAECASLWCCLGLGPWTSVSDTTVPVIFRIVAVSAVAISISKRWDLSVPFWPQFSRRIGLYCGIAIAISLAAYFWQSPPGDFYIFAPIWIGLMSAWFLGLQLFATGCDATFLGALVTSNSTRRFDILFGDAIILLTLDLLGWHFLPGQWPSPLIFLACTVAWLVVAAVVGPPLHDSLQSTVTRLAICVAVLGAVGWGWFVAAGQPLARGPVIVFLYSALLLATYRFGLFFVKERIKEPVAENIRWIILGSVWVFLFHPFFEASRHGTGDAAWYANMLADMIAQVRAGVFPVFSGQSQYQFNGAIYSLRVAPAFHYLGALVDVLTLRSLTVFAVQNLLLAVVGLASMCSCYFALAKLLLNDRWSAAGLTVLFISCPGVIGVVFNTDLYMSWMTVPMIPLVCYGLIRSFERNDLAASLLVGGGLGFMWWGHSPIALWMTLVGAVILGYKIIIQGRTKAALAKSVAGFVVFALVAAYPVLSVLAFPVEPGLKMTSFQVATGGMVAHFVNEVFPAVLLPVSSIGRRLSDFQLGYGMWILFGASLWAARKLRAPEFCLLLGFSVVLMLLLTPIPGLNLMLWNIMPVTLRNVTSNWAMNRLYLIMAGLLVASGSLALRSMVGAPDLRRSTYYPILALCCGWSLAEAGKFGKSDPGLFSAPTISSETRIENSMPTSFAYLIFPQIPRYFSHGVVDPQLENRLLSTTSEKVELSNADAVVEAAVVGKSAHQVLRTGFVPAPPDEEKSLVNELLVVVSPGKRYLAKFEFSESGAISGVLEITGKDFFRSYALPEYGASKSFGVGGEHTNLMPLWTTGDESEVLHFRLRRDPPPADASELMPFGSLKLIEYDPDALPIKIESWIPYRARVKSADAAWLEAPRVFQSAYVATVNGQRTAVAKSPDGLAMVAVPSGVSEVELNLSTPTSLKAIFSISLLTILGLILFGGTRLVSKPTPDLH